MYAVAIAELSPDPGASPAKLAAELGTTAYELKLTLNAGLPAVVLLTTDASRAADAVRAIEQHGHRAVSCDRREVVASDAMVRIVEVGFDPDALLAGNLAGDRLPYDDVLSLVRAIQRTQETNTREETSRKLRLGVALTTGVPMTKTVKRQVTTHTEQREQVLMAFRRSGATPWILRERAARYAGLGTDLSPTSLANFETVTRRLRERAPGAVYDERLLRVRTVRGIADGTEAIDLLAHLMAADLRARARDG